MNAPEPSGPQSIIDPVGRPPHHDKAAYSLRALGRSGLPPEFVVQGRPFRLSTTIKHDFFAATGFYTDAGGKMAVLKIGRNTSFHGIPFRWVGRWLCRREMRFYNKLSDLPNVPKVLGMVGDTGFVHEYVIGQPLSKDRPVPAGFFDRLFALLAELHRRGVAYVDTNKPENILLGDDGLPHLIDFQISWGLDEFGDPSKAPFWLAPLMAINRWWLAHLQHEDLYHVLKHKRRLRRDEMTRDELARAERKSLLIRTHRFVFKPYFIVRRGIFKRLKDSGRLLPEGSK